MEVKFFLAHPKNEQSSLQAIVRYCGERYKISTGESVLVKYWNKDKHRCRIVRDYPEAPYINQRLDGWAKIIEEVFGSFGLVVPTQKMVKDTVEDKIRKQNIEAGGKIENEEEQQLVAFAYKFYNESSVKASTKSTYLTTINWLIRYEQEKNKNQKLRFIDIDINFYNKFKNWMLENTFIKEGQVEHYSKNYIGALFKNIKRFMNESHDQGIHTFTGHKHKNFIVDREETDAIYLTQEELDKIYNLKITKELLLKNGHTEKCHNFNLIINILEEEKDRFLIGCYTALRQSDYSRLHTLNFKDDLVTIWTVKKDKKVFIPMHYRLREILERRKNKLPPLVSDVTHNKNIKIIGKLAGINNGELLTKTKGGKRTEFVGNKYEFITSHTARRSGATNMYLAGIDIKFIKDIIGHSKVEQTLKYIKVSAEDNARRLIDHPYFTGK